MTREELQKFSDENWNRIPEETRKKCLDHLRGWIDQHIIDWWKAHGIGHFNVGGADREDPMFHFHGGMAVRNRLRDVLRDDQLPGGAPLMGANWDDFYMGALAELIR